MIGAFQILFEPVDGRPDQVRISILGSHGGRISGEYLILRDQFTHMLACRGSLLAINLDSPPGAQVDTSGADEQRDYAEEAANRRLLEEPERDSPPGAQIDMCGASDERGRRCHLAYDHPKGECEFVADCCATPD